MHHCSEWRLPETFAEGLVVSGVGSDFEKANIILPVSGWCPEDKQWQHFHNKICTMMHRPQYAKITTLEFKCLQLPVRNYVLNIQVLTTSPTLSYRFKLSN